MCSIGSQKQRAIYQRDVRCHLFAEEATFQQSPDDPTVGTLVVDGHLRYQPLDVNGLVHIPGWGDFQLERIEVTRLPGEYIPYSQADPAKQESLKAENDVDEMSGEQTWPYQEEMTGERPQGEREEEAKKRRLPAGTSDYQAVWIPDDDAEGREEEQSDEEDDDDDDYEDMSDSEEEGEEEEEDKGGEEIAEEMESVDMGTEADNDAQQYDKKVHFADEEEELKKLKGIHARQPRFRIKRTNFVLLG